MFKRFLREDNGTTAVEYGVIGSLLVLAVAATLPTFGLTLNDVYIRVTYAFS